MSSSRQALTGRYRKNGDIIRRDIADEIILVPIRGKVADMQRIFTLDAVGDFIWGKLDGSVSLGEIHMDLLSEFSVEPDQAAEDLDDFVAELREAQLIIEVDES